MKKTPLKPWRRPKRDQVTPELVEYLQERDGRCIVPVVDREEFDRNPCSGRMTVEHVREHAAMGGPRAPSVPAHTVAICEGHVEYSKSARSKKRSRDYLGKKEGAQA